MLTIFCLTFSPLFIAGAQAQVDQGLPLRHSFSGLRAPFFDNMDTGMMRDLVKNSHQKQKRMP